MEIDGYFQVVAKHRKSQAKYVQEIDLGDILKVSLDFRYSFSSSNALKVNIYRYKKEGSLFDDTSYDFIGWVYQNSFFNGFHFYDENEDDDVHTQSVFTIRKYSLTELFALVGNDEQ